MARFKFSQIFKSTVTHLSGDERPDFAAVETLLGSKSEDEAVSDQQRQVATERLLRRWKFATYAMAFILCFLSITLLSLLRKQYGRPVREIFCEPASSSVDKGGGRGLMYPQHPQKRQSSTKKSCSTTTSTKTERHIRDLRRTKWTKPGTISTAVCRARFVVRSQL